MGTGRVANAKWERVPHSGGCNTNYEDHVYLFILTPVIVYAYILPSDVNKARTLKAKAKATPPKCKGLR